MILWFAGLSFVLVALVFDSPGLDYRLVMAGSVFPSFESLTGAPWVLHTLLASVAALVAVAISLRSRRLTQRRWVGVPIGMFFHLVLDGTWARTELFWWPAFGNVLGEGVTPELDRGWFVLVLELIGLAALGWMWISRELGEPSNRQRFLETGQLPRPERTR